MSNEYKPYIDRLKLSGLRPTKQRLTICKILFSRSETFHFSIENLKRIIEKSTKNKISLATLYNTVHAFRKNGYLREISLKGNKTFFDTNTKNHHHFYDEDTGDLLDINNEDILIGDVPHIPNGKKIREIEVTVRIASDNHNRKINN
tara:strand:- start:3 stop:443 length:441 start_codon:yes stop_codon:yes gene_type:complete